MTAILKTIAESLGDLLFPSCCPVCGRHLVRGERHVCLSCLADMPRLRFAGGRIGEVDDLFLGSPVVDRAVAMFRYSRNSPYAEIIKHVKYRNMPQVAESLSRQFAGELAEAGFFEGMDCIVPVPLHKDKQKRRGYNQSRFIADGLAAVSGLPVTECLCAVRPHATQTARSAEERHRNVSGVFRACGEVSGRRIVLVDDVITTGATLTACCDELVRRGAVSVRIMSLAFANVAND